MPIEKGQEWGSAGALPADAAAAKTDAALAALLANGATHARPTGGDLARTLGVSAASLRRETAMLLPIDAIHVSLDGVSHRCVANVVIGHPRRPDIVVANAAFLDEWNVAPRAHPGDGKVDIVTFDLGVVDWFKARKRLPTGSHVPHPDITTRSVPRWERTFPRPVAVRLDGIASGRARQIDVVVDPDAIVVGV